MSWAQENKGLTAFLALTVVSAGGLGYLLYDGWSRDNEQAEKWNSVRESVIALEKQDLYPNAQNVTLKKQDAETFKKVVFDLRADLAKNQPQLKELTDTQFQQKLKQAIDQARAAATAKNIRLPEFFAFGFNNYVSSLPKIEASSELDFQLNGLVTLTNYLIESGITSIEAIERSVLPIEEGKEPVKPAGKNAAAPPLEKVHEKSIVKVVFRGKQAAFQQAIMQLSNPPKPGSPHLFLRLVRVENEMKKGPSNQEPFQPYPVNQNATQGGGNPPSSAFSGSAVAPVSAPVNVPSSVAPAATNISIPVPASGQSTTPGSTVPPVAAPVPKATTGMAPSLVVNRVFAQIPPVPKTSAVAPVPAIPSATGNPSAPAAVGPAAAGSVPVPANPLPTTKMAEPMIDTHIILGNEELIVYMELDLIRYLPPAK